MLTRPSPPPLGVIWDGTRTTFRIWAPAATGITAMIRTQSGSTLPLPLLPESEGYFALSTTEVRPGDRYRYLVAGKGEFPDPWSRFNPDGVHGFAEVTDPNTFSWTDTGWIGVKLADAIIYELHIGTFTPEGSFTAATNRLTELRQLGITVVELMPLADFPGNRNWGYDGVSWFAPAHCYGTPDELRQFVNTAHRLGIAVLLDAVYNHLGPDGNYFGLYTNQLFTNRHHTPWGDAINYDGPGSPAVRQLVTASALHWIHDYHFDGLRLDATHAILDDGPRHFLQELTQTLKASAPEREILIIAEDERNEANLLRPTAEGGFGLDGVWADDFHHSIRRKLAGDDEGYYRDYTGSLPELMATIRQGWFYTGQASLNRNHSRGTESTGVPPERFVICIQNHDQIGNRAFGERLHHQIHPDQWRAASVLLLGVPETPLLFMGQEWAASTPFRFFTEHNPQLGKAVTEGRRREFGHFRAFADPAVQATIPDPQAFETFASSRLNWEERTHEPHLGVWKLYQELLTWRQSSSGLKAARTGGPFTVREVGPEAVMIDYGEDRVIVAFAAGEIALPLGDCHTLVRSDTGITISAEGVSFPRPGGVIVRRG